MRVVAGATVPALRVGRWHTVVLPPRRWLHGVATTDPSPSIIVFVQFGVRATSRCASIVGWFTPRMVGDAPHSQCPVVVTHLCQFACSTVYPHGGATTDAGPNVRLRGVGWVLRVLPGVAHTRERPPMSPIPATLFVFNTPCPPCSRGGQLLPMTRVPVAAGFAPTTVVKLNCGART